MPSVLADELYHEQLQKLYLMREQILSKPNTTTVLSRYGPYEDNNDPIPVADFEKMCFDFSIKNKETLKSVHFQHYEPSSEKIDEVVSLWKADLKYVCENDRRIIKIIPSLHDFCSAISKTISGFYKVVLNFTSLTSQDELLPYITQTKYDLVIDGPDFVSEWPDVAEMKNQNNQYEFRIENLLNNTFEKSMELIQVCVII